MANFTIWRSFSRSAVNAQTQTIYSWAISWIEATTLSRLSSSCLPSRWDTQNASHLSGEITRAGKSHRFTDSMTSVLENMVPWMSGDTALTSSTTLPLQQSSTIKYSVFTEDWVHRLTPLMRLGLSIGNRRCHMMEQCATSCGVTLMIHRVGVFHLEVQDISLEAILWRSLIERIRLIWYVELISWSWTGISLCLMIL